jgi:L-ascorbate metabolism protein UlaG (beta-lactamase superfamily)
MMNRAVCLILALTVLQTGCARYTRDIFWENKVKSTPYAAAKSTARPELWGDADITYAWLGHATVLINFNGTLILTDPVLHDRIGPPEIFNNMFGIKRLIQLPLNIEDIPDIDLVLISHPHFDHLDLASLDSLNEQYDFRLIVPVLNTELLGDDFSNVLELDWLSRADVSTTFENIKITAFRVEHYGYADWGDRDVKRGFNGYLISGKNNGHHIAFFGDTSYSRYRDEIGNVLTKPASINWRDKFSPEVLQSGIDLCIIPIGDSYYYWNHISPEKAIRLANELNCNKMLPIHYSTFLLTPPGDEIVKPKQQLLRTLYSLDQMDLVRCDTSQVSKEFPDIGINCILR